MPLPFEIQREEVVLDSIDYSESFHHQSKSKFQSELLLMPWTHTQLVEQQQSSSGFLWSEPTSVLDTRRSLSSTSISTMSSTLGSSGSGRVIAQDKCSSVGMDELSDFGAGGVDRTIVTDQSMSGYYFGDRDQVDDDHSMMSLNKFMHGSVPLYFSEDMVSESCSMFPLCNNGSVGFGSIPNAIFGQVPVSVSQAQQQLMGMFEEKPQVFNPNLTINQQQVQPTENSSLFLPMGFGQQENGVFTQPNPKRLNTGMVIEQGHFNIPKLAFSVQSHQQHDPGIYNKQDSRLSTLPTRAALGTAKAVGAGDDEVGFYQQEVVEDIFKVVELIQGGNLVLAQGILARLNHQLSLTGKPFQRVAFYFKESLELLLEMNGNSCNVTTSTALSNYTPSFGHILKIGAYKSFSEASPVVHFANFTCNQAILESVEGFDKIHVLDFDIGYGAQWASLMQELAIRNNSIPSLRITAFTCPSTHDDLEFGLVQENLNQFAIEVNLEFELRIRTLDGLSSMLLHVANGEAVIVNLPVGAFATYPLSLPHVLRAVKQMSPIIVVSLDRGCDRNDLPFPHHAVHAFQSYTTLLESVDASVMNSDMLQQIERFFIHPNIERMLVSRHLCPDKILPWRTIFLSSGFSQYQFSNVTESQADYLVKRAPSSGFHVEKRQSSIVLCWQQTELISVSAWRC